MSKLTKALTAAAGNAGESLYVEDVFSTYLYTGNSSTQTITNGIDLAGEGGLVWLKSRSNGVSHALFDTERGASNFLVSNNTNANDSPGDLNGFNSNGFDLTLVNGHGNFNNYTYASWSFRKAKKFFDVVTWTGSNNSSTDVGKGIVPHNLGVAPAVVIVKNVTQGSTNWIVYHKDQTTGYYSVLNSTAAETNSGSVSYFSKYIDGVGWQQTNPDADNIYVGYNYQTNGNTDTIVAYLFASDAGGFGDDGTENIIKCGSFTNNSASVGVEVNCGFEPQWLLIKGASTGSGLGNWVLIDSMRGASVDSQQRLYPNASTAEGSSNWFKFTSQGFTPNTYFDGDLIYIAIRRPMKTPESGTEVFDFISRTGTGSAVSVSSPILTDALLSIRPSTVNAKYFFDRPRGGPNYLDTTSTSAEGSSSNAITEFGNDYIKLGGGLGATNGNGSNYLYYLFQRATGFFDVVAYTGDGVAGSTQSHNLGVVPECMIVKRRDGASSWITYWDALGATKGQFLDNNQAFTSSSYWNDTAPTATQLTLGSGSTNNSGATFIAYLFATLAGVSKVGSYTGTGSNVDVDCGFSAGARFILIKRSDSTGDWYVWDSERGIVAGNDPYLLLNSTAAEVTSTDYIDPLSSGFTVTSSAPAALNASGGTYIFMAIS